MKIVFIGSSKFGLRCLEECCNSSNIKVVGIVTATEVFGISYRPEGVKNVLHAKFVSFAESNGIPIQQIKKTMVVENLFKEVAAWKPEAFIVAGWYHMIPKKWRELAPAYGLHASLLPDYSGGAPLTWAIINGETRTGITMFQIDNGVDTGPIVYQLEEPIYSDDTIATLYARIEILGQNLLRVVLPKMASGLIKLKYQEESKRRIMPQRSPSDGLIDWSGDANKVERFIRAQTKPYPGAFSIYFKNKVYIWKAKAQTTLIEGCNGTIYINEKGEVLVKCGNGSIKLENISIGTKNYEYKTIALCFNNGESLKNNFF